MWKQLKRFWNREDRLTIFLCLLFLLVFVVGPTSGLDFRLKALVQVCFGLVLIAGVSVTFESRRLALLTTAFVAVALVATAIQLATGLPSILAECCDIPPLALLLYVIIEHTLRNGPVNADRIKGAVIAYLLIGLLWAKFYMIAFLATTSTFYGISTEHAQLDLIYFSFVTLTSVGYGDITPVHEVARVLANIEAIVGQLFPAIFIARVISRELMHRR